MEARDAPDIADAVTFMRLCLRSRWQSDVLSDAEDMAGRGSVDWDAVCEAARAGGLAPLLYDTLRSSEWPPDIAVACLQDAYHETAVFAGVMSVELNHVLRLLADAGLPAIVLKGAALGDTLYGNSALRPMTDLDLLLHEIDVRSAIDLLREHGYRSTGVEVRPGHTMTYENELVVYSPGTPALAVELHWHLLDSPFYQRHLDEAWFWDTSRPAQVAETGALVLGLEATVLHLSAHYALHHKAQGMRWIYDIAGLVAQFGQEIDWRLLLAKAVEFRLISSVQAVLRQLVEDWSVAIPADVLQAANRLPVSAEEMLVVQRLQAEQRPVVQRFWADLTTVPGWRKQLPFLLANLFPSPAYMEDRYDLQSRAWLPLAYPYRWALGVSEFLSLRLRSKQ